MLSLSKHDLNWSKLVVVVFLVLFLKTSKPKMLGFYAFK
jgi:hypothetical protein